MKRDILFDELTPLSFKTKSIPPPPVFSVAFVFEVLTAAFCWVLMPSLTSTCEAANLYLWLFILVIGINMHLFAAGIENFIKQELQGFKVIHSLFLTAACLWMGYGHYLALFKGLTCWDHDIFWASTTIMASFDLVGSGLAVSYAVYCCRDKKD